MFGHHLRFETTAAVMSSEGLTVYARLLAVTVSRMMSGSTVESPVMVHPLHAANPFNLRATIIMTAYRWLIGKKHWKVDRVTANHSLSSTA